jgi:transposase-like protein
MSYPNCMNHLEVLREKIGRLRAEIARIHALNERYRCRDFDRTESDVAHEERQKRLQAIQQELTQLADLGRKVQSVEEMREKHRCRLHLVEKVS